ARNAEFLKQEAGVRAGGCATENSVKELSLNWSPEDKPTPEHMIATAKGFLRHMNWHEHQVVMVAHNDKQYAQVHLMLNVVHPETGRHLDDGLERRRAQKWALAYEQEQGRVYCEQRLKNPEEREKNMPRNMYTAFQENKRDFEKSEKLLRENAEIREYHPNNRKSEEWKILKEIQKDERLQFFADGKNQFSQLRSTIYREVREEFRERWANYYSARKNGTEADKDILADVKAKLIAEQKAVLEPRRDAACAELKEARSVEYRGILDQQQADRAEFRGRLETGQDNAPFFHDVIERQNARREIKSDFRAAAHETTERSHAVKAAPGEPREINSSNSPETESAPAVRHRVSAGAISFLDALFFDVTNLGSAPKANEPWPGERDEFAVAAEEATKQAQHQERESVDAEWNSRQKAIRGE
ncbi:MAG: relaxase/mobilization nuclease domain-containing protein, partial [Verrucomicrobiota bacterium]